MQTFRVALSQMLFNAIFQFSNLFINTYLFKTHGGEGPVASYNLCLYIFWILFFDIGFRVTSVSTKIGLRLGAISGLSVMAALLLGLGQPLLIGVLMGAAGGFFWPAQLTLYRNLGARSEDGSTFAKVSMLTTMVSILNPLLFGFMVQDGGYTLGFVVMVILALGIFAMSFWLPVSRTEPIRYRASTFRHPGFIGAATLNGFFFSFIGIASGLLVFLSGQGEAGVGTFNTFFGVAGLIVNVLIGYLIPERYNRRLMLFACVIFAASSFLFLIHGMGGSARIIVFNFFIAAANPMFTSPFAGSNFAYINRNYANPSEGLLIREFGFTIGRVLLFGYMLVFGLNPANPAFYGFLFVTVIFPFAIFYLTRSRGSFRKSVLVAPKQPQSSPHA